MPPACGSEITQPCGRRVSRLYPGEPATGPIQRQDNARPHAVHDPEIVAVTRWRAVEREDLGSVTTERGERGHQMNEGEVNQIKEHRRPSESHEPSTQPAGL